jgi:hypothetical protein
MNSAARVVHDKRPRARVLVVCERETAPRPDVAMANVGDVVDERSYVNTRLSGSTRLILVRN